MSFAEDSRPESADPEACMRLALRLALDSVEAGGGPFGAVVVRGSQIVGRGRNRVTSTQDPTAHAEVVALRDAAGRLRTHDLAGCQLYTSCEPCPMCYGAALWSRVERVVFAGTREDAARAGFDDSRFHDQLALPLEERELPLVPLLREEASAAFEAWLAKADRATY
jgi:tRNA(Arg) A34 adenosine deaminase TadA